jgi:hypothetical protein
LQVKPPYIPVIDENYLGGWGMLGFCQTATGTFFPRFKKGRVENSMLCVGSE